MLTSKRSTKKALKLLLVKAALIYMPPKQCTNALQAAPMAKARSACKRKPFTLTPAKRPLGTVIHCNWACRYHCASKRPTYKAAGASPHAGRWRYAMRLVVGTERLLRMAYAKKSPHHDKTVPH